MADERNRMLMSPAGANERDQADWAVVVGVTLVAEIALLWCAACIALWRRRVALDHAASRVEGGGATSF